MAGVQSAVSDRRIARDIGPKLEECLLKDNDARNKIAVIEVDGIITSHEADPAGNNMVDVIKAQLDRAKEDCPRQSRHLEGGFARRRSDGFGPNQQGHRRFSGRRHGKPVICSMGSLAASGGYYISAPCRWIVGEPTDPHRQHRRHHGRLELSRPHGQDRRRAERL